MERKPKILIITFMYPNKLNPRSGIFIKNQYDLLRKNFDLKIIFPYPYVPKIKFLNPFYRFSTIPKKEIVEGIEVYHPKYLSIPKNNFTFKFISLVNIIEGLLSYISARRAINGIYKNWKFDIIKVHGCATESFLAVLTKKKYGKPLIVVLHGEDINHFAKLTLLKPLSRWILSNADKIIVKCKSQIEEAFKIGIKDDKFHIIPSGYAVKRFFPVSKATSRKKLNIPHSKKIILFVGGLVKRKAVEYLIMAAGDIIKKNQNALIYIVGDGPEKGNLEELSRKSGVEDSVYFAGEKKPDEVPLWMNACDLLVLPSLNESLANVLSEAMACSKPVVATRVAGSPDIVNRDVGYLIRTRDPKDLAAKVNLALKRKWNRKKLLRRAHEFSVIKSVQDTADIYRSLLR